jgi:asparagine synthase (glutamine-hydrolysing)
MDNFGALFLGNTRLAIVDVPGGVQPYTIQEAGITCVFNGEIYNHYELREALRSQGHTFKTKSDGEVIPHLYLEHGIAGFKQLRGMFAIALFDSRSGKLILARDHFGKKPLYFDFSESEIFFASELKSLLSGDHRRRDLNHGAIGQYLQFGVHDRS